MAKQRVIRPAGSFLGPTGMRRSPMRKMPVVADDRERVEKIRAAVQICDEPEAVGRRWLEDWAEVRRLEESQQHAIEVAAMRALRPMLDVEDRVRDIERRAKRAKVDMSRELHLMRQDIERAKRGNRKPPLRVIDRCERLEATLDGVDLRSAA